ncbi:MAG TPA: prephenate dehydrogenase/arogenate dehydrogenase family protein [Acidimicrobiales bacterium]|nr:prephenate dehydrogenase/arogenate dehydrogenase family protein [Acidimicrobiales bacterium]
MTSPAEPAREAGPTGQPAREAGPRRAAIVGTGLIGGSIGLALRARGWHVTGWDAASGRTDRAVALGALDVGGVDPTAEVTFIATPVSGIVDAARDALARMARHPSGVVTDVGGVKGPIVSAVDNPRFVGGHPMAGSEQEGIDGADGELFAGATWVLTPTASTDPEAFTRLRTVVASLGADVVALPPERHDDLVAVVSHVPHLAAATLMGLASEEAEQHGSLLRLAAGGFRDMTRVAAGHPGIWPDICAENAAAIATALDHLATDLSKVRDVVASGDQAALIGILERAREARRNLPARLSRPEDLVEVRVPVPDRPGVLAEVTTLAGELGVNIEDLEIAHSVEGDRGVLVIVVDAGASDLLRGALLARGYRPSHQRLG